MTWLTSDEHYFHRNILGYCNRPFKDEYHMNDTLLDNHNRVVHDDDTVIHVGDLSAGLYGRDDEFKKILLQLKGHKILIMGNHDHNHASFYEECGFTVGTHLELNEFFICHYPLYLSSKRTVPVEKHFKDIFDKSNCTKIIHGHNHNNYADFPNPKWKDNIKRFNCSVEVNQYTPVKLETIINTLI